MVPLGSPEEESGWTENQWILLPNAAKMEIIADDNVMEVDLDNS